MRTNNLIFLFSSIVIMMLFSCTDKNVPEHENENNIQTITVSQAKEIGMELANGESTSATYSVTGYVILADAYGAKNAGKQTFYMSDDKNATKADLSVMTCEVQSPGFAKGDRVIVVGKISKYATSSSISIRIEYGTGHKVDENIDPQQENNVEEISVTRAKEIGNLLADNEVTSKSYSVTGYVIIANAYGAKNAGKQTIYMSDNRNATQADISVLNCEVASPGLVKGDKVKVVGKICKYVVSSSIINIRIENGMATKINDAVDISISGTTDGHDYVDLGLSVKWATCNLGAQNPLGIGNYYAWGEITPYTQWTYVNYNFTFAPCSPNHVLDAQYDAVTANWGKSWRMPTKEEIDELIEPHNCDWIWLDNINGTNVSGYQVVSKKNGRCIFLPAGKYQDHDSRITPTKVEGHYWSSTTGSDVDKHPREHSPFTIFFSNGVHYEGTSWCFDGLNIRGVVGTPNTYFPENYIIDEGETSRQGFTVSGKVGTHTYVDLGLPSRTLWATYNLGANLPHEYGEYYTWGETQPKDLYNEDTYKFFIGHADYGTYHWAQYSKYIYFEQHGTPDYKTTLDPQDDAATVNWGAQWQMPSKEQLEELAQYCIWYRKDVTINGQKIVGFIGESKINGYTIYIPYAGMKYEQVPLTYLNAWYWSRDLSADTNGSGSDYGAWYMTIQTQTNTMTIMDTRRVQGLSVRPVVKK